MKIWIIVFEEVIDFVTYHTKPYAYSNEETARKAFADAKKSVGQEYAEEIEDEGWTLEEGNNYCEVYEEEYSKNHYRVDLYEVELNNA